ncbi:MAG: hypothetical protein J6Y67_06975 [Lachnospiraceae bacterium]|nr:hypothetical protein [Lachnospiraceae bacterium]
MAVKKTNGIPEIKKEEAVVKAAAKETEKKVEKAVAKVEKAPEEKKVAAAAKKVVKKAEKAVDTAAKKVAKTVAKKADTKDAKATVVLQFAGAEFKMTDILEAAKKDFAANNTVALKTITLYVKPEDGAAYYVANDDITGKVNL